MKRGPFHITVQGVYKHDQVMTRGLFDWMTQRVKDLVREHLTDDPNQVHWEADPGTWAKLVPVRAFLDWGNAGRLSIWGPIEAVRDAQENTWFPQARGKYLSGSHARFRKRTGYNGLVWLSEALKSENASYTNVNGGISIDNLRGWQLVRETIQNKANVCIHFVDSEETSTKFTQEQHFGGQMYRTGAWDYAWQVDIREYKQED